MDDFVLVTPLIIKNGKAVGDGYDVIFKIPEYINLKHVARIRKYTEPFGSFISFSYGDSMVVKEEPKEIANQ